MNRIALCFLAGIAFSVSASQLAGYKADGVEYKLPRERGDVLVTAYQQYAKALESCSTLNVSFENPLNARKNGFSVTQNQLGCLVVVNRNNSWVYKCYLNESNRADLVGDINQRVPDKDLFGDFSDVEKSIYFDKKRCKETKAN